jgi:hypothetical protein
MEGRKEEKCKSFSSGHLILESARLWGGEGGEL